LKQKRRSPAVQERYFVVLHEVAGFNDGLYASMTSDHPAASEQHARCFARPSRRVETASVPNSRPGQCPGLLYQAVENPRQGRHAAFRGARQCSHM